MPAVWCRLYLPKFMQLTDMFAITIRHNQPLRIFRLFSADRVGFHIDSQDVSFVKWLAFAFKYLGKSIRWEPTTITKSHKIFVRKRRKYGLLVIIGDIIVNTVHLQMTTGIAGLTG